MKANPVLYQVDVRDWLYRIGASIGRAATFDDVPDSELERLAGRGFDWIWLLGIWQTGQIAAEVSSSNEAWQQSFADAIPDLQRQDIAGSIFAVYAYDVHTDYGGASALQRIRARFRARGMSVMLDFVPNHTAIDHPWVHTHPEYYVPASVLEPDPRNYISVETDRRSMMLAHGRDPNFPGWPDTLQLNYGNAGLQRAMVAELQRIAAMCDGVRCDMAMLELPDVYRRTWNIEIEPFWPRAIAAAHSVSKDFVLMAEVYWGLEWELQQLGFDYTYDKELYDRLRAGDAGRVRGHLTATHEYQSKSVRFLENHDEPRAAQVFDRDKHKAAAMITYFVPGMRFFHDGQLEGFQRKPSCHLRRRYAEAADDDIAQFYDFMLSLLKENIFQNSWTLLESPDPVIAFTWRDEAQQSVLIAVNYASYASAVTVKLPSDLFHQAPLTRVASSDAIGVSQSKSDAGEQWLDLNLPAWGYGVFRFP